MTVEKYSFMIPADAEKSAVLVFDTSKRYWLDGVLLIHSRKNLEWQTLEQQHVHLSNFGEDSVLLCGGCFDGEYGDHQGLPDIRYYAPRRRLEFYECFPQTQDTPNDHP